MSSDPSLRTHPASDILHGTRHSLYIMTLFHRMMRPTDWHATDYKLSHPCIDCTVLSCGHDRVCWLLALFSVTCGVLAGPGQWWSVYLVLTPGTQETAWLSPVSLDSAGVNIQTHHSSGQLIVNTASCHWQVVARTYSRMCECDYFTSEDVLCTLLCSNAMQWQNTSVTKHGVIH